MEHEIVMDLLPLYHDGVCSDQSRAAVEAHLQSCPICRKTLEEMDTPLPSEEQQKNQEEAEGVRKLSKAWKQGKRRAWFRGMVLGLVACALVLGGLWLAGDVHSRRVSPEDITLQVYRAPGGEGVYIHWDFQQGREAYTGFEFQDKPDGRHYYLSRPLLKKSAFKNQCIQQSHDVGILFEGEEIPAYFFDHGDHSILLWKDGEIADFPVAPPEIYNHLPLTK